VPVREALKILEGEGFVQIIPRRGAFVTEISVEDMEDLYFAREILEGQAAYHAAIRLTPENIQRLEQLYAAMEEALKGHVYPDFMGHNRVFHFVIYDAADSGYLSNLISGLWDLAERYRYRYLLLRDQGLAIQAEHRAILDACVSRDPKALRDSIIQHMRHTLTSLKAQIEAAETAKE
jgi:DNA-binding GntR family transcriptional regulator